jgi:predicted short-subunit dehydrogenase-like oxidoreductase (DUF2520 family)
METAQSVVDASDIVFLCVPDDAIEPVAGSVTWRRGVAAVHCSGALGLGVLANVAEAGGLRGAFHPLQLFADAEVAARHLRGAAVAVEADGDLIGALEGLAERIGARPLRVPAEARAAYHAGSHYAAAFICVLLAEGATILEHAGIDADVAAWGLQGLARGTLEAIHAVGPAKAMAGAYARGDAGTAARHLEALDRMGLSTGDFYRTLADRSVELARTAGRIDEAAATRLRRLLKR